MEAKWIFWSLIALCGVIWSLTGIGFICYSIGKKVGMSLEGSNEPDYRPNLSKFVPPKPKIFQKEPTMKDLDLDPIVPTSID